MKNKDDYCVQCECQALRVILRMLGLLCQHAVFEARNQEYVDLFKQLANEAKILDEELLEEIKRKKFLTKISVYI